MKVILYFDEDSARSSFARELRARGADLVTPQEAGMTHKGDEEQLEWAALHHRAIYSFNRGDFCRLHTHWLASGRHHSGIILSRQDLPIGEQLRRLLRLINSLSGKDMRNRLEFLSTWR